jgi:ribosome-associated heat shock protein Hsp15
LDRQRIDKWLWNARIVRTRADAAELVQQGHVRVDGERVRAPGRAVKAGNVLTVSLDRAVRVLRVKDFRERRGAAGDAAMLYEAVNAGPPAAAPD